MERAILAGGSLTFLGANATGVAIIVLRPGPAESISEVIGILASRRLDEGIPGGRRNLWPPLADG
jgi:hypothetical protein